MGAMEASGEFDQDGQEMAQGEVSTHNRATYVTSKPI
ncbi:hypothetical protein FOPG_16489 [Fusarium oxysporum f. sp. conglutinans race 2 54008]|uniref:Uncharacterized protein n=1 Tax=Fusarium oxysporum f. sp. conglutinans race 2 54008 TaxID=1089457 RepID=X0GVH6_FUSOX|nr:hypothetical protein FOPG_16489 [Fusarium oxysporum f. sp. conglutinans race 2 54008]